jgi:anthranilate synthase component 1
MTRKYNLKFTQEQVPADTLTPVGVYLRLRDAYPGALLLECTDYSSRTNAFSYICLNPVLGFESNGKIFEYYFPGGKEHSEPVYNLVEQVNGFLNCVVMENAEPALSNHGLFGYTSFDSVALFEKFGKEVKDKALSERELPMMKYDLFKIVLTFNHFNDTLTITEYYNDELPSGETSAIHSILANHNSSSYPFQTDGDEVSCIPDESFKGMVNEAVKHCSLGDVFQLVVSRRYRRAFTGDEFNVYRSLRSVNPSPYLFYFDYIAYRIFGSSPEPQIRIQNGKAVINPIAGTIRRTGNIQDDLDAAKELLSNPKENSEHVMLVDLARNDLSRSCTNVKVEIYREVQTFSHVLHLVSTVSGDLNENETAFNVFAKTFPAGTLSGAPKHKAVELISRLESAPRGYYGGAIGFIGLDNTLNNAITIRSFLSRNGYLNYQAGAGIVIDSADTNELNEVNNKLDALRLALKNATNYIKY